MYFSPSGLLNQISFSAIANNKQPIILRNQLVQLSSTSKLTHKELPIRTSTTLLIGGINYDYNMDEKEEQLISENDKSTFFKNSALMNIRGTKNRGESWTYLKGTLNEIESLTSLFQENSTEITILKGDEASEATFKELSGNSPNLIHIATHGFFYENRVSQFSNLSDLSLEDHYRLASDPLLRSGLIMAGANYSWKKGHNPPNAQEDGILTAHEISNLDLSNTDLVVLSACETGLGDIEGSEGVYGLQRAFKMAGVDHLIMSLWKVPDEETAIFMKTFYNNWLKGSSIRDAFTISQRQLSKSYYNEPSKWAAFVLFE